MPILQASSYGFTEIVKILVNNNADVTAINEDRESALIKGIL